MKIRRGYGDEVMETEEPTLLSEKDLQYRQYASAIVVGYVDTLCKVLMHSQEKIFTRENKEAINHYGNIQINDETFPTLGYSAADILLLVRDGHYKQNEVLHDTAMLASPFVRKAAIEFLDKKWYLKITRRGLKSLLD